MNRNLIIILSIIGVLAIWMGVSYNGMVNRELGVTKQWADIEAAYQARMDKSKNLAEIVKGAANFEKSVLTDVIEARAKATSIQIDPSKLTPETIKEFEKAQGAFSSALGRLLAVAEKYPELQAVQSFRDFQTQYEGMENRIQYERNKFNEVVQSYNAYIRTFPRNLLNAMFGFQPKGFFTATQGAEKAPDIKF